MRAQVMMPSAIATSGRHGDFWTRSDPEERGLVESQLESVPGYRAAMQVDD